MDGLSFGSVISHSEGETPHVEAKFVDPVSQYFTQVKTIILCKTDLLYKVGYLSAKSDSDSDDTLYGDVVAHTPKLKVITGIVLFLVTFQD